MQAINLGEEKVKAVSERNIRIFDGPGRGRKQCPSCNIYIGVRTVECNCGHTFEKRSAKIRVTRKGSAPEKTEGEDPKVVIPSGYTEAVIAPAGKCPVQLEGCSQEEVAAWADKVRAVGRETGEYFTSIALRYYLRYFFDFFSEEYKMASEAINVLDE